RSCSKRSCGAIQSSRRRIRRLAHRSSSSRCSTTFRLRPRGSRFSRSRTRRWRRIRARQAHELLAAVATYRDFNWAEAKRLYARAAELEPGAGFDRFLYAFFLAFSGDIVGGLQSARLGRRLDPVNFLGFLTESIMLVYSGDPDAALPLAMRPSELDPQYPEGYHTAGYVLLGKKDYARAAEMLGHAVETSHRGAWPMAKLGCAFVGLGRHDDARALLAELEQRPHEATMSATAVAVLQLHLGNREEFY